MPKKRRDEDYLLDMKKAVELALGFVKGMPRSEFDKNKMCQSAVTYQLAVLGEAAKQVSKEYRAFRPNLPWKKMTGLRDLTVDLPGLLSDLESQQ